MTTEKKKGRTLRSVKISDWTCHNRLGKAQEWLVCLFFFIKKLSHFPCCTKLLSAPHINQKFFTIRPIFLGFVCAQIWFLFQFLLLSNIFICKYLWKNLQLQYTIPNKCIGSLGRKVVGYWLCEYIWLAQAWSLHQFKSLTTYFSDVAALGCAQQLRLWRNWACSSAQWYCKALYKFHRTSEFGTLPTSGAFSVDTVWVSWVTNKIMRTQP